MITPYANIGEANQESSFLTNKDGCDVAVLSRVLPESVPSYHQTLTDEQWQQVIDLIAAAPEMLAALEAALEAVEYYHDHEGAEETIKQVRDAIALATGGAL